MTASWDCPLGEDGEEFICHLHFFWIKVLLYGTLILRVLMSYIYVGASGSHNVSCLWVNLEALGEGRLGDTGVR